MRKQIARLVTAAGLLVLSVIMVQAAEFIIFDGERDYTESDKGFMYYWKSNNHPSAGTNIPSQWPKDWTTPYDYYNGYWMVRYHIKSKPTDKRFAYACCIWQLPSSLETSTAAENESCAGNNVMDVPNVYVFKLGAPSTWWKKNGGANAVDYTRPHHFKRCGLVYRAFEASPYCYVTPYSPTPNCWDKRADYLPVDQRVTIIAVSKGATFSGWGTYGFGNPKVMTPYFEPAGGTYAGRVDVRIRCGTAGASIRYTTDGTTPTASSPSHSMLIPVTQTTTIKAIAIKTDMDNSDVASATYTITVDNTPPVIATVSASGDPTTVSVTFNETVDQATALATGNYAIDNGVTINSVTISADKKTTTLNTSALQEGTTYTLTVNNIKDLSDNVIAANTQKTFQFVTGWTDDFNDGNYTANQTWTVGEGTWSVSSGKLGNSSATGRSSIYGGQASWTDYTYSADVTPVSGSSVNDVWMIFRVQDKNNYYLYTLETGKLYKLVNGSYTELASGSGTYSTGTTYRMKVELSGSSIKIYANNNLVLSTSDNTYTKGYVGFGSNNATGTYDNVEVLLPSSVTIKGVMERDGGNFLFLEGNPFAATALFSLKLEKQDYVSLNIYSVDGREVTSLVSGTLPPNNYRVQWDAAGLPQGVYLYRLRVGDQEVQQGRVMVTK